MTAPSQKQEADLISKDIKQKQAALENRQKQHQEESVTLSPDVISNLATTYNVSEKVIKKAYAFDGLIVGDSIITKTYDQLVEGFPNAYIDAAFGRTPEDTIVTLDTIISTSSKYDKVILSLGTNQGQYSVMTAEQIDHVMNLLEGKDVYWVTINLPSSTYWWTDEVNQLLIKAAEKYGNLHLIDWYAISSKHSDEWFEADGFHPNQLGSYQYVSMLMKAISQKE